MSTIPWLGPNDPFPDPQTESDPDPEVPGLLAVSERIFAGQLLRAYQGGIFPWYSERQPVLWWSPDPRMVLQVDQFKLHRSLRKTLQQFIRSPHAEIRIDSAFGQVIRHCAGFSRPGQNGTWIVQDMVQAYEALHAAGHAHSVETWVAGELVGGLYAVSMGAAVFGESMFALRTDASKIALSALVAWSLTQQVHWIDCQQNTPHLASLGASEVPREDFLAQVQADCGLPERDWRFLPVYWNQLLKPASSP